MLFESGNRLRRFKFTVRPESTVIIHGPQGPTTERVKALRAIFKYGDEHTFDSVAAQKEFGWSDVERELVEKALQDPDNGYVGKLDGRGIWPAKDLPVGPVLAANEAEQCAVRFAGSLERCPNKAIDGGLYCDVHVIAAIETPAPVQEPEPTAEVEPDTAPENPAPTTTEPESLAEPVEV